MKNSVFVFNESPNLISKYTTKLEKLLVSQGLFDFSFLGTSDFEIFLKDLKEGEEAGAIAIVICPNDKLDACLEAVKNENGTFSLIDEQAVKFEDVSLGLRMLFVPSELEVGKFLKDFLSERETFIYSIFGKSRKYVDEKFVCYKNNFECDYKIITLHPFLHNIYSSKEIESTRLEADLGCNLFSRNAKLLQQEISLVLNDNNKKLMIVECCPCGRLISGLKCEGKTLTGEKDFVNFGVSQEILEGDNFGKEATYAISKYALKNFDCDYVLTICDGLVGEEKSYVSVGDKSVVHLYSSVFQGEERTQVLSDFALFRLLTFLKEQKFD